MGTDDGGAQDIIHNQLRYSMLPIRKLNVRFFLYSLSDFELSSKSPAACAKTGLKETLKCNASGLAYRRYLIFN
jgi:hypothetical protein